MKKILTVTPLSCIVSQFDGDQTLKENYGHHQPAFFLFLPNDDADCSGRGAVDYAHQFPLSTIFQG